MNSCGKDQLIDSYHGEGQAVPLVGRPLATPNPTSEEHMKAYEYEPVCTRHYDGLYCDGPCKTCDEYASDKAAESDYNRGEHEAWLASTPGAK